MFRNSTQHGKDPALVVPMWREIVGRALDVDSSAVQIQLSVQMAFNVSIMMVWKHVKVGVDRRGLSGVILVHADGTRATDSPTESADW